MNDQKIPPTTNSKPIPTPSQNPQPDDNKSKQVTRKKVTTTDDERFFEVEEFLGTRYIGNIKEYYIKWKGFPESENSWVPRQALVRDGIGKHVNKYDSDERKKAAKATEQASHKEHAHVEAKTATHDKSHTETKTAMHDDTPSTLGQLPPFSPCSSAIFKWGERDGLDFIADINKAFEITSKWRKNVFKLPSGATGKHFTQALSKLYIDYGECTALESIALKAASIFTPLMLQQPLAKSSYKENKAHLARRLTLWDEGNIKQLLSEGASIQARLPKELRTLSDATLAKRFATMVFNGNFKGAMSLIMNKAKGGVLPLNEQTRKDMQSKHPKPEPQAKDAMISGDLPPAVHNIIFDGVNGESIKKFALRSRGGAGVSQQEDKLWHIMVSGFKETSSGICNAIAKLARRLCTQYVDPEPLACLLANRGVAIDKCPGLRPVGVGEMLRRIIGKAVMSVTRMDVQKACGPLQLCAGQPAGVESAIHAMRNIFEDEESDGVLLIDADNAFNRVNRAVALWNIQFTCPAMKHILINFYRKSTRIFMRSDDAAWELLSQEGTTQGCPLAMAMYALALCPLMKEIRPLCNQVWYADDATGCDKFAKLRVWFDALLKRGPKYGYFPKPEKCILVTKPERLDAAREAFKKSGVKIDTSGSKDVSSMKKDSGIEILANGTRHLGAAIGTTEFKSMYVRQKVTAWTEMLTKLADIAKTQPHAAFAAYIHCLQNQWNFVARAMPDTAELFQPLEDKIRQVFLPSLLLRTVSDNEREVLSMPARFGGLGIFNPTLACNASHENSKIVTQPIVDMIMDQSEDFDPMQLEEQINTLRKEVDKKTESAYTTQLEEFKHKLPTDLISSIEIASVKGASSWVTTLPLFDQRTILHKGEFVDAMYLRYGWVPPDLPTTCACGARFDVTHAFDCKVGGYRIIQHNEVRDLLATSLREAGYASTEIEPKLQPLTGEEFELKSANKEDDARSDVKCTGFWRAARHAYFDIKLVSPLARSYAHKSPKSLFNHAEKEKIREYGERIREVEHGDFNPIVFTTAGGIAPQCHLVLKRIAERIAERQGIQYSKAAGWLRCRFGFAVLRTSLMCLRGTRRNKQFIDTNIELAVSDAKMSLEN